MSLCLFRSVTQAYAGREAQSDKHDLLAKLGVGGGQMCFSDVLEGRSGSAAHTTNRKSFVFCGDVIRILTGLITAVIIVNVPLNLESSLTKNRCESPPCIEPQRVTYISH